MEFRHFRVLSASSFVLNTKKCISTMPNGSSHGPVTVEFIDPYVCVDFPPSTGTAVDIESPSTTPTWFLTAFTICLLISFAGLRLTMLLDIGAFSTGGFASDWNSSFPLLYEIRLRVFMVSFWYLTFSSLFICTEFEP